MTQREAVYDDLLRALQVMRIVDDKTPKPRVLYAMWLLETKQLCLGYDLNVGIFVAEKLPYNLLYSYFTARVPFQQHNRGVVAELRQRYRDLLDG